MGAFENLMQAGENEQRHEGPFDICCWWDRTTPHCVVNVVMCLSRPAALGEGGKWRNMRTGTPLQPDKCFICSLCYEHTHMHLTRLGCSLTHRHCLSLRSSFAEQLRDSELMHGAQHLPIYSDTKTKNGQWQNYRCHFPYYDHWRVSHRARSCAPHEITLPPFTADLMIGSLPNCCLFVAKYAQPGPTDFQWLACSTDMSHHVLTVPVYAPSNVCTTLF